MGRSNVEKAEFIRPFAIISRRDFDRITRIAKIHKTHALHDSPLFDIETGNDAFGQHVRSVKSEG